MNENEIYVPVEKDEFECLLKVEYAYDLLIDSLLKHSSLNYNGEKLSFSGESIDFVLQMLEPQRYESMLSYLKREKARKEKEEKDE